MIVVTTPFDYRASRRVGLRYMVHACWLFIVFFLRPTPFSRAINILQCWITAWTLFVDKWLQGSSIIIGRSGYVWVRSWIGLGWFDLTWLGLAWLERWSFKYFFMNLLLIFLRSLLPGILGCKTNFQHFSDSARSYLFLHTSNMVNSNLILICFSIASLIWFGSWKCSYNFPVTIFHSFYMLSDIIFKYPVGGSYILITTHLTCRTVNNIFTFAISKKWRSKFDNRSVCYRLNLSLYR